MGELWERIWLGNFQTFSGVFYMRTLFISRFTRRNISIEKNDYSFHSPQIPIPSRNTSPRVKLNISKQDWAEVFVTTTLVALQTGPPHFQTWVQVTIWASELFQVGPASLEPIFAMLHDAPSIIKPTQQNCFLFSSVKFWIQPFACKHK